MAIHRSALGFETAADDYERARPSYPPEAMNWLASKLELRPGRTVVDLAAGTGKLTRLLVNSGARVIAVEPVAGMRRWLADALPPEQILEGTAEDLPLGEGSTDTVTVAQAFHWFDGERALSEIHRVTRPGGRLAVIYNRRPLDHPLQAALESLLAPHRGDTPGQRSGRWRAAFAHTRLWTPGETFEITHLTPLSREGVAARVASTSFIAKLPADRRERLLEDVRAVAADYEEPIELPHNCEIWLWERV